MRVVLASRSSEAIATIQAALQGRVEVDLVPRLMSNGHADPLHGIAGSVDLLLLRFDSAHLQELSALAAMEPASRPPLVLIGPAGDAEAMRLAIRSGARDFLVEPVNPADLVAALERVRREIRDASPGSASTVSVVLGAAGGVGTTLVSANLAHRLAVDGHRTLLLDLDLVCAPAITLFDMKQKLGLVEALAAVQSLDAGAIDGYAAAHGSGLRVLGAADHGLMLEQDVPATRLSELLHRVGAGFRHVVVDAGYGLGPLATAAVSASSHVFLVLQQSVLQVRNATRLYRVLTADLGVAAAAIHVVVNRHQKSSAVSDSDVRRVVGCGDLVLLPNQFKLVRDAVDTGVPLYDLDRGAPLTRALGSLAATVSGETPVADAGRVRFLDRALPIFGRRL